MDHKLILTVPEDIYEPLAKSAECTGQTPEETALEWLASAAQTAKDDPLEQFIGAFRSNVSGWSEEHDRHLGQALLNEAQNKGDEGRRDA